jgi:hypothetical protein
MGYFVEFASGEKQLYANADILCDVLQQFGVEPIISLR